MKNNPITKVIFRGLIRISGMLLILSLYATLNTPFFTFLYFFAIVTIAAFMLGLE